MSGLGLFSKPKKTRIPPRPVPSPTPEPLDEEAIRKDRERRRQRMNAAGRAGTILTEGGLGGSQAVGKQTLLGGSVT